MDRGTGLTKAMVEALPESGAVVVVHTGAMRSYVERMILDLRGKAVASRCKVRVIQDRGLFPMLHGLRVPIIIDHAVEDYVHPRLVMELKDWARALEPVLIGIDYASQPDMTAEVIVEGGRVKSLER